ncbi:MAG TPA: type II toxin-antitoxin system HigB family toxin [Anaerolineales bacterium]|nr:type II toxin-antitoxin system HigB family toxin [Anaerolineales bacterium]
MEENGHAGSMTILKSGFAEYLELRYHASVHIISRKTLIQFREEHPDKKIPLARWFKIVDKTDFHSFTELRHVFPSIDKVNDSFIFNIAGMNIA